MDDKKGKYLENACAGYVKRINDFFLGKVFNYNNDDMQKYKDRYIYFSNFFDTSRMNSKEIYLFVFSNEHKDYLEKAREYIRINEDDYLELFEKFFSTQSEERFVTFFEDHDLVVRQFYRDMAKALLWTAFLTFNNQKIIDNIDYWRKEGKGGLFRGQSDFSWQLKPSILRGFEPKGLKYDGCLIDREKLYSIYSKTGLIDKYNKHISEKGIINSKDINYDFLSFMQHSISYSPLIDFTTDIDVACKFALSKSDPNTYLYKDSAIFIIMGHENYDTNEHSVMESFKIIYLNKKIKPGTFMNVDKEVGGKSIKVQLDFTSIGKIMNYLRPKFVILEKQSNDRMKFQKGKFVLFYDYVSVEGNVYYFLNKQIAFLKKKVEVSEKDRILNSIDNGLNNSYLMNPYMIFND